MEPSTLCINLSHGHVFSLILAFAVCFLHIVKKFLFVMALHLLAKDSAMCHRHASLTPLPVFRILNPRSTEWLSQSLWLTSSLSNNVRSCNTAAIS